MAKIDDYIHSLGLKAGIYTDAGRDDCSMYPDSGPKYMNTGSEGHYEQDFLQFSKWGFELRRLVELWNKVKRIVWLALNDRGRQ